MARNHPNASPPAHIVVQICTGGKNPACYKRQDKHINNEMYFFLLKKSAHTSVYKIDIWHNNNCRSFR